jgi:hypothetical protein
MRTSIRIKNSKAVWNLLGVVRNTVLLTSAVLLCGCSAYYRSYRYRPNHEIHEVTVHQEGAEDQTAKVDAKLIGILRPQDEPVRKLHARLSVENTTTNPLVLRTMESRAIPSGVLELEPQSGLTELEIAPGVTRSVEILFPLPSVDELPNTALHEIELSWVLGFGNHQQRSTATFQIAPRYYNHHPYYYAGYPRFHYGYHHGFHYGHYHYSPRYWCD